MGFRVLFRSPMVALVSVVTLGLGIGGTTAVFSVADGVLLNPMNFPESNRLVTVFANFSYDNFRDLQSQSRTLESIGVYRGLSVAVTGLGEPERIRGEYVSASYFDVLRARPAIGRLVRPDEAVPGGELTTVLSHGYWERRFESDPSILGQTINFNNLPHTIVGVMPPDFRSYWDNTEAWISPQTMPYGGLSEEGRGMFFPIARLADGVELETAERELDLIIGRLEQAGAYPDVDQEQRANVRTLASSIVRNHTRSLVWILLAAVGLVLLIATANVAGLQLARALRRSREMAIRAALGGGRARLMRQLLVENLTLALLGGIFGIGVAVVILRVLEADSLTPFTRFDIELNALALGVAALLTLGTGTLAGLVPAMRGSAIQPASGLREDNRSGSEGRGSSRFRSGLVIAQMAMTVTLLVGASLLLRTAGAMNGLEQGFDAENVLTGETRLTAEVYQDEAYRRTYLEQVVGRLAEIPGVQGSTLIKGMPFAGDNDNMRLRTEGSDLEWEQALGVYAPPVAQGYFEFMGIPVVAGRTFRNTDGPEQERVLVVSRNLAAQLYPGTTAVGRMVETPGGSFRIVGVVENTRESISTEFRRNAYVHYLQAPPSFFSVLIRTEGAPERFDRALLEAFWSVDANQPLWEIMSLERRMAGATRSQRFFSVILGGFAGLALLLAAVGLYGVMAYSVERRWHELGVRMALGAERGRILHMVLRQGVGLTALGALVGIGAAAALVRFMAALLFGVSPFDVLSFTAAPVVLVLVAVVATYIPARRATHVDPVEALRS